MLMAIYYIPKELVECLVGSLACTICLWVEGRQHLQLDTCELVKVFSEVGDEQSILIRHNVV